MARILLVEDDLDVCLVMEHALIDGGHTVDATGRVLAAFVLLGSHTGYAFSLPKDDLNRFEFLLKPFRQKELLQAVERVLQTELT